MPAKRKTTKDRSLYAWAAMRIGLGFIFLWAFLDKMFGLGFATCRDAKTEQVSMLCEKAWVEGGSPTVGFLKFGTKGPFADFYQSLAGNNFVDLLFMSGLLLIGIALITGIATKLAAISGSLLLFLMWTAVLLPENNPVLDDHIIYIVALAGIYLSNDQQVWGLKDWWEKQPLAKAAPFLR